MGRRVVGWLGTVYTCMIWNSEQCTWLQTRAYNDHDAPMPKLAIHNTSMRRNETGSGEWGCGLDGVSASVPSRLSVRVVRSMRSGGSDDCILWKCARDVVLREGIMRPSSCNDKSLRDTSRASTIKRLELCLCWGMWTGVCGQIHICIRENNWVSTTNARCDSVRWGCPMPGNIRSK